MRSRSELFALMAGGQRASPAHPGVLVGLLAAALLVVHGEVVWSFVQVWLGRDEYSHGFLVPFIALFLAFRKRARLRELPVQPSWVMGVGVLAAAVILLLMGSRGNVVIVRQLGLLLLIPGLVTLLFGKRFTQVLAVPLGYLLFTLPVLDVIGTGSYRPLQIITASAAGTVLGWFGVPVLRSEVFLELPTVTLEVAEACSGLRYLISIMAVAVPLAFVSQRTWRRRLALLALAASVSILANILRVTLIGLWVHYGGGEVTHGPFHILQGLFVSVIGYVVIFLVAAGTYQEGEPEEPARATGGPSGESRAAAVPRSFAVAWVVALVLAAGIPLASHILRPLPVPPPRSFRELPAEVGDWKASDPATTLAVPGADEIFRNGYRNAAGRQIDVGVGYFASQKQGKRLADGAAQLAGRASDEVLIAVRNGRPRRVRSTVLEQGARPIVVLYWYELGDEVLTDKFETLLRSVVQGFLHGRTNGAVVVVSAPVDGAEAVEETRGELAGFVEKFFPLLRPDL